MSNEIYSAKAEPFLNLQNVYNSLHIFTKDFLNPAITELFSNYKVSNVWWTFRDSNPI